MGKYIISVSGFEPIIAQELLNGLSLAVRRLRLKELNYLTYSDIRNAYHIVEKANGQAVFTTNTKTKILVREV